MPSKNAFDETVAGDMVETFLRETIVPMQNEKPEKFENILEAAHVAAVLMSSQKSAGEPAPKRRRRIMEDSSSPVRPDSE